MNTDIVDIEPAKSITPMDSSALKKKLKEEKLKRQLLDEYITSNLVANTDYALTHAQAKKPSLTKSGSEKICSLLNLDISFVPDSATISILPEALKEKTICLMCILTDRASGIKVAEGRGACSLDEKKTYSGQYVYNVNSIVKLAEKRAQIDATLRLAALSGRFAQDEPPTEQATAIDQSKDVINQLRACKTTAEIDVIANYVQAGRYVIPPAQMSEVKKVATEMRKKTAPAPVVTQTSIL